MVLQDAVSRLNSPSSSNILDSGSKKINFYGFRLPVHACSVILEKHLVLGRQSPSLKSNPNCGYKDGTRILPNYQVTCLQALQLTRSFHHARRIPTPPQEGTLLNVLLFGSNLLIFPCQVLCRSDFQCMRLNHRVSTRD